LSLGSKEHAEDAESLVEEAPEFNLEGDIEGLTYDEGYLHLSGEVEARIAQVKQQGEKGDDEAPSGKPKKPADKRDMLKRQQSFA